MIITKRALPRRTVLRGLGAAVSLPLLDAMVPALSAMTATAAKPVRRLGFVYIPNGVAMTDNVNHWTPDGVGADFTLSPILKPLEALQEHVVVVSGLSHREADSKGDGNGDHTRGSATWLNGIRPKPTEGADVRAGTTADQIAASALGQDTPLSSVEIGLDPNYMVGNCEGGYSCIYMNTLAWRTPTTPLPAEVNPRVVFERLFGDGGTPAQQVERAKQTRSVLDAVREQMARLQQTLGPADRAKAGDYFDAVREIERRIQHTEDQGGAAVLPALERPLGIPDTYEEHVGLMFELQRLAFQADITRVFTFMMGRETSPRTFPEIGVLEPHHLLSHHANKAEQIEKFTKVNTYQVQQFASFLETLRETPDGDGTLLDHSLWLYGGGLSDGNEHSHINLPLVLAGGAVGRLQGGRHLEYPIDTPMTNLLLSVLEKVGVTEEQLGDSTGHLPLDHQPLSGV